LVGVELQEITVPLLPDAEYAATLVRMLESTLDSAGHPPFTALMAWGIEDGGKFRGLLSDIGMPFLRRSAWCCSAVPDLVSEHADFFHTVGCCVADQVEALHQAIDARGADPFAPYGVRLTPVTARAGGSVTAPPKAASGRRAQR
jgi:hypothetical protein